MEISALVVGGIAAGRVVVLAEGSRTYRFEELLPPKLTPQCADDMRVNIPIHTYYLHAVPSGQCTLYFLHRNPTATPFGIVRELMQFYHNNQRG